MCCNPFKPFFYVLAALIWIYIACEIGFGMQKIEGCQTMLRFVNHSIDCCKNVDNVKCHITIGSSPSINHIYEYFNSDFLKKKSTQSWFT
jgi:hypothetical protein